MVVVGVIVVVVVVLGSVVFEQTHNKLFPNAYQTHRALKLC